MDKSKPLILIEPVTWGRRTTASFKNSIGATFMILACPIWVMLNWTTLEHFGGSFLATIQELAYSSDIINKLLQFAPVPTKKATLLYAGWLLWQGLLFRLLPGPTSYGQRTPGGHLLRYKTNGLLAWIVSHAVFEAGVYVGLIDPAVIAKNWPGLLVAANVYGLLLAVAMQIKAYIVPSHPADCKYSGSLMYDLWAGIELNPRLGDNFDLKLFHNGRPGLVAWSLIDISFAAYQRQLHGSVSYSMMVVTALHTLYALDFFANEDWYLRTIDITHDHFGFMLSWGDAVFLPSFYTLQAQYLARYPGNMSLATALALLLVGLAGYTTFRLANAQRDAVRAADGKINVWGKPATFLRCRYRTKDNEERSSILITSGWWGLCRHANYTADIVLSWAECATCVGPDFVLLPWSYFLFMTVLLVHRAKRDERRCSAKYGAVWDKYMKLVPYTLVPGIY